MEIGSKSMKLWIVLLASMVVTQAYAGQVTVPNTFVSGTKAKASEVNANFSAVQQGINDNDARISQNTSDIYTNTTAIGTINSQVSSNQASIQTNASAISQNTSDIYSQASSIQSNTLKISANTSDIYTNTTAIGTINSQVSSNQASIQTNASAILGNAANIATNASNITANASGINANSNAITTLQQAIPATYQVVDSYGTVLGDLLGADLNTITFISSQGYLSQGNVWSLTQGYIVDGYTSVDCTGPATKVFAGGVGRVFDVASYDIYGNVSYNRSYIPLNATTANVQSIMDLAAMCMLVTNYPYTPKYYVPLPNDPAITGIPNTIGFPLRIQ